MIAYLKFGDKEDAKAFAVWGAEAGVKVTDLGDHPESPIPRHSIMVAKFSDPAVFDLWEPFIVSAGVEE